MATTETATSEIESVNLMLASIGEAPVNYIADNPNPDVTLAKVCLSEANRVVQSRKWSFNSDYCVTLVPTFPTGEILVPTNVMRIDSVGVDKNLDVVQRGPKLYNRKDRTFVFTKSVKVDMLLLLPFNELPEAARHAISVKAARKFQARALGSTTLYSFTKEDENEAWIILEESEADTGDHNMFTDNYTVASGITRYRR